MKERKEERKMNQSVIKLKYENTYRIFYNE